MRNINQFVTPITCHLEFYIELPFNLSIPTGIYALNVPKQIKIHRDLYLIQKGNPMENLASMQKLILPQDRFFDENGLVSKEYADFQYKRKMRTTIFIRYRQTIRLRITEDEFYEKIKSGQLNSDAIQIPQETLKYFHKRFIEQVNNFLIHYVNFIPVNSISDLNQYEVRPLSNYEFSKCETGISLNYKKYGLMQPPIIQDFNNLLGNPENTLVNLKKIKEFERVILKRNKLKILPFQELFNLARSLFRTNKEHRIFSIITNAMTSFESILKRLEEIESDFQKRKKKDGILSYYLNRGRQPIKEGKITRIKLARILKKYNPEIDSLKAALKTLEYLDYGRLIRNEGIHDGRIRYHRSNDIIVFYDKTLMFLSVR